MSLRPSGSGQPRRPPSSASTRPPSRSSASAGPSSGSAAPFTRPSSSASAVRPSSSASSGRRPGRSDSRATHRPASRLHDYTSSRQASRLAPLYRDLIARVAGINADTEEDAFETALDYVTRSLDQTIKPGVSSDMTSIGKQIRGHTQKARVNCNDDLADAVEDTQKRLKDLTARVTDLDDEIQLSRLPNHMALLLALSNPPNAATLAFSDNYMEHLKNPDGATAKLTWAEILAEEPLEGQHWEGVYGLPPGAVKRSEDWNEDDDYDARSHGSTPSLSPWDDEDDFDQDHSSLSYSDGFGPGAASPPSPSSSEDAQEKSGWASPAARYAYRTEVEELQARQYWRPQWQSDVPTGSPFSVGNAPTLGPAFRLLAGPGGTGGVAQVKYISEHDAVREVLMGLQGLRNIMFTWITTGTDSMSFVPSPTAPALMHLSPASLNSIIASFAATATTLEQLRKFVSATFTYAVGGSSTTSDTSRTYGTSRRTTRTLEAFAEAVGAEALQFDQWCASREEQMCLAQAGIGEPIVVSLLSLESAVRQRFSESFRFMHSVLRTVVQRCTRTPSTDTPTILWTFAEIPKRHPPSAVTAVLLDTLLLAVEERASMGDDITSAALERVFRGTAAPLWDMVHRWLKDGMPLPEVTQTILVGNRQSGMDEEFFVEDNELGLLDPDFWCDGYMLRGSSGEAPENASTEGLSVPLFLRRVAQHVLEAGKAVGLLRALGIPVVAEVAGQRWMDAWRPFDKLLLDASASYRDEGESEADGGAFVASTEDFARMVYDELVAPCKQAKEMLTRVLIDDCDLWLHLTMMEDLYLMRRGDVADYLEILFSRMDSNLDWNDFHFLNSSFADVVASSSFKWIEASLVRIAHHSRDKTKDIHRTVRAIEGLTIQYAVPFPLTYIFGPKAMQTYSAIFVLILQIRRAKSTLERILVRDAAKLKLPRGSLELKLFYAMRGRLLWFVNALLGFVCTNVLHTEVLAFHDLFRKASSLDEMITLHNDHLAKMESQCLLQRQTAAIHRAVISILDMALHFSDCFVAFAAEASHDISYQSIASTSFRKHKSRKQRRQRRNVIGFSQVLEKPPLQDSSSSSESETEDPTTAIEPSFSAAASISFVEESFADRVGKMSSELDALVRFVRRGVEGLAAGTGDAASAFEIFAFVLEDWDL